MFKSALNFLSSASSSGSGSSGVGASPGRTLQVGGWEVTVGRALGEGGFADLFLAQARPIAANAATAAPAGGNAPNGDAGRIRAMALKRMRVARDDHEKHHIAHWEMLMNVRFKQHQ